MYPASVWSFAHVQSALTDLLFFCPHNLCLLLLIALQPYTFNLLLYHSISNYYLVNMAPVKCSSNPDCIADESDIMENFIRRKPTRPAPVRCYVPARRKDACIVGPVKLRPTVGERASDGGRKTESDIEQIVIELERIISTRSASMKSNAPSRRSKHRSIGSSTKRCAAWVDKRSVQVGPRNEPNTIELLGIELERLISAA